MFLNRNSSWRVTTEHVFEETPWQWSKDCNVFVKVGDNWYPDIHNISTSPEKLLVAMYDRSSSAVAVGTENLSTWLESYSPTMDGEEIACIGSLCNSHDFKYIAAGLSTSTSPANKIYFCLSEDQGKTFKKTSGKTFYYIRDIISPKEGTYIFPENNTTSASNIAITEDSGKTWGEVKASAITGKSGIYVEYLFYTLNNVLALCSDNNLYYSTDYKSWSKFPVVNSVRSVSTSGTTIVCSVHGYLGGGFYISTDEGKTWSKKSKFLDLFVPQHPDWIEALTVCEGKNIFICFFTERSQTSKETYIAFSSDGGNTWVLTYQNKTENLISDVNNGSRLYLKNNTLMLLNPGDSPPYLSTNSGVSFETLPNNFNAPLSKDYKTSIVGTAFLPETVRPDITVSSRNRPFNLAAELQTAGILSGDVVVNLSGTFDTGGLTSNQSGATIVTGDLSAYSSVTINVLPGSIIVGQGGSGGVNKRNHYSPPGSGKPGIEITTQSLGTKNITINNYGDIYSGGDGGYAGSGGSYDHGSGGGGGGYGLGSYTYGGSNGTLLKGGSGASGSGYGKAGQDGEDAGTSTAIRGYSRANWSYLGRVHGVLHG